MLNINLNKKFIPYFKLCFFILLFIITVLSLTPHNNISSQMHEQSNSLFWELADKYNEVGSIAYFGEDLFGVVSDKIRHIFAFLVLSFMFDFAYTQKSIKSKTILLVGYGFLIEILQYFIPFREFGIIDVIFDTIAVLFYYLVIRKFVNIKTML